MTPANAKKLSTEDTARLTADEIFDAACQNGLDELKRSSSELGFSGFISGLTISLTPLAVSIVRSAIGNGAPQDLISKLLYPLGFVTVIIGRSQLFTENTLYPVVVVLRDRKQLWNTLRLWAVVLGTNLLGTLTFAFLFGHTSALKSDVVTVLVELGQQAANQTATHLFWSGIVGGWLMASVAWLVTASHWTTGQVAVVWVLALVLGLGSFTHCVVGSSEVLVAVVRGALGLGTYVHWLLMAVIGNVIGGVVLVTVLNYGQIRLARG